MTRGKPVSRLKLAVVGLVVIAAGVYGIFTKRIPFLDGYQLKAVFDSSNQLTPGFSPVRIAGVTVGSVRSIEDGPGAKTVVVMELDDDALPVRADARARIRPRLFLEGGFYVELSPGSPSAPELEDGGTIPNGQTALPVQLHQILTMFDRPTRQAVQDILKEFDKGLGDGGARALGKAFEPLAPVLRDTAWIAEAARGERPRDLSQTVTAGSRITAALASRDRELSGLVTSLSRTTAALASRDEQVAASIREIGGLLEEAPPQLDRIDAAMPAIERFVAELRPSLRALPPVLEDADRLLVQAEGLVGEDELPRLVDTLAPTVEALPELQTRLGRLFPLVTPVSDCVREKALPVLFAEVPDGHLSTGYPVWQDLVHSLVGLASANQNFDGNGYAVRYLAGAGDKSVGVGTVPGLGELVGLSTEAISGSSPRPLPPGEMSPFRPDAPCMEQEVVDLGKRSPGPGSPARTVDVSDRPAFSAKRFGRAAQRALRALRGKDAS